MVSIVFFIVFRLRFCAFFDFQKIKTVIANKDIIFIIKIAIV